MSLKINSRGISHFENEYNMRHKFVILSLSTQIMNSIIIFIVCFVAIGVHRVSQDGLQVVRIRMKKIRGFNQNVAVQCVGASSVF